LKPSTFYTAITLKFIRIKKSGKLIVKLPGLYYKLRAICHRTAPRYESPDEAALLNGN